MAPLHPLPAFSNAIPRRCGPPLVKSRARFSSGAEPSTIAAVGLTLRQWPLSLDRDGRRARNAILSPDQRAKAIVARWRAEGAEARAVPMTYNGQSAGKPLLLIAWQSCR
jgi:sugar (pentulose or hexulose) kinase